MNITEDIESDAPLVVVFSDYNLLVRGVTDDLISKGYEVIIVSTDQDNWNVHEKQSYRVVKPDFLWVGLQNRIDNIVLFAFEKENIDDYLTSCRILSEKTRAKTLIITNYSKTEKWFNFFKESISGLLENTNIFAGVLYLGEIFERSDIHQKIVDSTVDNKLIIDPKEHFFPITRSQAIEQILKSLLSLAVYGKSLAVASLPLSSKTLFKSIVKYNPDLEVEYSHHNKKINHSSAEKEILEFDLDKHVKQLINKGKVALQPKADWENVSQITPGKKVQQQSQAQEVAVKKNTKTDVEDSKKSKTAPERPEMNNYRMKLYENVRSSFEFKQKKQRVKRIVLSVVFVVLFPYFIFIIAMSSNKIGDLFTARGSTGLASSSYKFSAGLAFTANEYSRYLSHVPLLGLPYENSLSYFALLHKDSSVSTDFLKLISEVSGLLEKSFKKDVDDINALSEPLYLTLDNIYGEYGHIKADINSSQGVSRVTKQLIVGRLPSEKDMKMMFQYREVLESLPEILGEKDTTIYALLLIDNRIKRPGGGVIEAVSVLTFDRGELINLEYYDAAELDSRLRGTVKPPVVLIDDTADNELDFYLKDALYSSHFPESAEQVEWFLDKELSREFDGIISLDMVALSSFLQVTGAVNIDGELVQEDIVNTLKLGSEDPLEKDSYFKDLASVVVNRITQMNKDQFRVLLSSFSEEIYQKHLMLYFNSIEGSYALNSKIAAPECNFENCFNDLLSISEVEKSRGVAVNKQVDWEISIEESVIKHELTVYYKNQSGLAEGEDYQSNLIISAPLNSSFTPGLKIDENSEEKFEPRMLAKESYKQAVIPTLVAPGKTRAYQISWEGGYSADFEEEGQYRIRVIKQPGEEAFPVNISLDHPGGLAIRNNSFDLTNDGTLYYNTQLSEDIDLIFSW